MDDALCEPRPIQRRLPILIGGSGPTKTLRTTARYADMWNGYGPPERIAATSEILRQRCEEAGRPYVAIERTVTIDAVVRETEDEVAAAWGAIARRNGLEGRVGSDGSDRGLSVGGPVGDGRRVPRRLRAGSASARSSSRSATRSTSRRSNGSAS